MPGHISSESSEWTSDSDGDYISPPRARKNRHTRKHLSKLQSVRIIVLEDKRDLFVKYKGKIYPLVKDGKILKKILRYLSDKKPTLFKMLEIILSFEVGASQGEEEDESYWIKKYLEIKKKIEELTRN